MRDRRPPRTTTHTTPLSIRLQPPSHRPHRNQVVGCLICCCGYCFCERFIWYQPKKKKEEDDYEHDEDEEDGLLF